MRVVSVFLRCSCPIGFISDRTLLFYLYLSKWYHLRKSKEMKALVVPKIKFDICGTYITSGALSYS